MEGRILVVQLARLGDLVQTWPLLRRLGCRDAGLGLLADQGLAELHPLGPAVSRLWHLDMAGLAHRAARDLAGAYRELENLVQHLQEEKFRVIYNLNFSRLSLLLAALLGGEVRGYRPVAGGRGFLRDPWLALVFALVHVRKANRLHLSDVFRHLAPPPAREPEPPRIQAKGGPPVIALQLATRHPRRTWALERFRRLTEVLLDRLGGWIWLLGTRAERALGERLRASLPPAHRERVVNLQGRTSLSELGERLREARLLISGDTGTLHLAAALGTQTVGVYLGPASGHETGPYGVGHYVVETALPCHPCAEAGEGCDGLPCQNLIPPEGVAEVAVSLAAGEKPAPPAIFPPEVTLYESVRDELGISYIPVRGAPGFWELVGLAYRRAAARLVGVKMTPALLSGGEPAAGAQEHLEALLRACRNGGAGNSRPPEVASALLPLQAFRRELGRQRDLGRNFWETEAYFEAVAEEFRRALEELGSNLTAFPAPKPPAAENLWRAKA